MKIRAEVPSNIQSYVDTLTSSEIDYPTRVYFPEVLRRNIQFVEDLPITVYLAHKATKTQEFLTIAKEQSIGIDVASEQELENALRTGIDPKKIEATGPKNKAFIKKVVEKDILISVDSLYELQTIKEMNVPTRVLIRIANPSDKEIFFSKTKFGIQKKHITTVKQIVDGTKIDVQGFHYHGDGISASMRGQITKFFLDQIETYFPKANKINLGGGFSEKRLRNPQNWHKLIQNLIEKKKEGKLTTWGTKPYGIQTGKNNQVVGSDQALLPSKSKTFREQLLQILTQQIYSSTAVRDILEDTNIELLVEPGHALLYNTGIAIFPVSHTKKIQRGNLVVVNGNTFMISKQMREPYADPELLTTNKEQKEYEAFIGGLLCRDDDIFMSRQITLNKKPQTGDLLVFYNQGSYESYQEGTPQSHPLPETKIIQ